MKHLDTIQYIRLSELKQELKNHNIELPLGTYIEQLCYCEPGDLTWFDMWYCDSVDFDLEEEGLTLDDYGEDDIKDYQLHKVVENFFREHTDLNDADGIYILVDY